MNYQSRNSGHHYVDERIPRTGRCHYENGGEREQYEANVNTRNRFSPLLNTTEDNVPNLGGSHNNTSCPPPGQPTGENRFRQDF